MTISLPLPTHPARELIDVAHLAVTLAPENRCKLASFGMAKHEAAQTVASDPAIVAVHSVAVRADGTVALFRFGKRGGWRKVWTFGKM